MKKFADPMNPAHRTRTLMVGCDMRYTGEGIFVRDSRVEQ